MRLKALVALSLVLMGSPCFATDPPASAPTPAEGLRKFGQSGVDELKKPEYAGSRCMLSPVFASDGMTVALSTDAVFSAGDAVLSIGGEPLDPTSKHAARDVTMKHEPTEKVQVKIRRSAHELTVTAQCADVKPFNDAMLEAAFAASKGDFGTCADKVAETRRLHPLNYPQAYLGFNCSLQAKRFSNLDSTSQAYYELNRLAILQNAWSSDALGNIRGTILAAVDKLQKNKTAFLGDDLKRQYDDAVAARAASQSSAITAAATAANGHP
jgi:hypothetical protein